MIQATQSAHRNVLSVVLDLQREVVIRLQMMLVMVLFVLPLSLVLVVQHKAMAELGVNAELLCATLFQDTELLLERNVMMVVVVADELHAERLVVAIDGLAMDLHLGLMRDSLVNVDRQGHMLNVSS